MVLSDKQCSVGALNKMRNKLIVGALSLLVAGCVSKYPVLATSAAVDVYAKPEYLEVPGNRKVGALPANIVLSAKSEVMGKDFLAYEVEYVNTTGTSLHGYVLLGSPGLEVRKPRTKN